VERIDLIDFPLPMYNQDIETKQFPSSATQLADKVRAAQALVISSPENNGSISAVLKNTIDWISRAPATPWLGKNILLMGASPGALGAVRGLWHGRVPFEALGCFVYTEMSGLAKAHEAFADDGNLKDKASFERLAKLVQAFIKHIEN
jgi:chromate reductase